MKVWELIRKLEYVKNQQADVYLPNDETYYNENYLVDDFIIDDERDAIILTSEYEDTLE